MKANSRFGVRSVTLAIAVAVPLMWSAAGYAQTQGMENRDDRRDDRGEARDTRQEGRDEARDTKQECKDEGGNRMDCRQEKRDIKQDARGEARDVKTDDAKPDE